MTYTFCAALRPQPRAKSDEAICACADGGGVTGICTMGYFNGPDPGGETTIEDYAGHIEHAVKVEGRGWSDSNLEKLLGLNWLRLFRDTIG